MLNKLINRTIKKLPYFIILIALIMGCTKETEDKAQVNEKRFLEQYLFEKNITTTPLPSGMYFIEKKQGTGAQLSDNDWYLWNYTLTIVYGNRVLETTNENVAKTNNLYSATKLYGLSKYQYSVNMIAGLYQGLKLMKEGGQSTLIIPSEIAFGSKTQQGVPAYSTLVYDIELVKVIPDIEAYEAANFQNYIDALIDTFSYENMIKTNTGVYYFETQAGTGDTIGTGKTADIFYKGYLMDGRVFDSNLNTTKAFSVTLGEGKVIQGWESVLKLMKYKSKGVAVIPWDQAYGESGNASIQPYTNLVFEMQVDSVR